MERNSNGFCQNQVAPRRLKKKKKKKTNTYRDSKLGTKSNSTELSKKQKIL